jgi:hypothetical protein
MIRYFRVKLFYWNYVDVSIQKRKRNHGSSKEPVAEETIMDVGQVARSDQDEEDDDEMLFVRGASPIMRSGYSPPTQGFHDEPFGYMEPGELIFMWFV